MARIVELILADEVRGSGTAESICRTVMRLYTRTGYLVAEYDPCGVRSADNVYSEASWFREIPNNSY